MSTMYSMCLALYQPLVYNIIRVPSMFCGAGMPWAA